MYICQALPLFRVSLGNTRGKGLDACEDQISQGSVLGERARHLPFGLSVVVGTGQSGIQPRLHSPRHIQISPPGGLPRQPSISF